MIITCMPAPYFLSIICKLLSLLNASSLRETLLKLSIFMDQIRVVTDKTFFMKTNQCDEPACGICVTTSTHHPPTTLNWSLSSNIDLCLEETRTPKSFGATHQPLFYFFFHSSIKEDSRPTFPPSNKSLDKQPNIWPMHLLPTSLTRGQQLQCLPQTCQKKLQKQ